MKDIKSETFFQKKKKEKFKQKLKETSKVLSLVIGPFSGAKSDK